MKKSKDKISILFVYPSLISFIKRDLEILQRHYYVTPVQWNGKRSIPKIASSVLKSDITFSWFASNHAALTVFFSKLFRKKSIIFVGGYEVAYIPEINYGIFLRKKRRIITAYALLKADKVLVVDPSLEKQMRYLLQKPCKHVEYLPTGYDPNYFKAKGEKEDIVLTVGTVNWANVKRKGFETFVKVAESFPEIEFVLVGNHVDDSANYLKSIAPRNVNLTGFVTDEELLGWYQKSKIYCQFSKHEGLPNSLCEAMLCECIPVGSFQNGIPRAIANNGFYATWADEKETIEAIKKALNASNELGKKSRKRIKNKFPTAKREKSLIRIIEEYIKKD